ncbi:VRR-NUC domain containing protein [uncultured Caudovirales phage]|uniref:VRR-NUC domain containing protein n=1 Tax=uncultured Caudovirales phage TaxID=2100421 RepID=A0A6J7XN16_9CAUD|nr:VRR-NUC domain containing protein [uncultured Caudovirales phage]CAB5229360.1 VRR-NUC domain containing protein [uncultured Caudovirales phage]
MTNPPIKQSESHLQQQCVKWLQFQYSSLVWFHVPNGGQRNIREAVRFKREGVKAGVADIILLRPNKSKHGLLIELKTKSGKQSPDQKEFQKQTEFWNYQYSVCRNLDEFMKCVNDYVLNI